MKVGGSRVVMKVTWLGFLALAAITSSGTKTPTPTPVPTPARPSAWQIRQQTTQMIMTNKMGRDGVLFCISHPWADVYMNSALTKPAAGSEFDITYLSRKNVGTKNYTGLSTAAKRWGQGNPTTLAFGLKKGESVKLWLAPKARSPGGTCWFQDEESHKKYSLSMGPMYMSQAEWSITSTYVSYDITSVEGLSSGMIFKYTDRTGAVSQSSVLPKAFKGNELRVQRHEYAKFPVIYSDKHDVYSKKHGYQGVCQCTKFDPKDPKCNTDICYASCPGALALDPCGQHRCRTFYKEMYSRPTSYCGWLYRNNAQTYCWSLDEVWCEDNSCGYGGEDQPTCEETMGYPPAMYSSNVYSCGWGTNLPARGGGTWWKNGPGCSTKHVLGVQTNPTVPRRGGVIHITWVDLPWMRAMLARGGTNPPTKPTGPCEDKMIHHCDLLRKSYFCKNPIMIMGCRKFCKFCH